MHALSAWPLDWSMRRHTVALATRPPTSKHWTSPGCGRVRRSGGRPTQPGCRTLPRLEGGNSGPVFTPVGAWRGRAHTHRCTHACTHARMHARTCACTHISVVCMSWQGTHLQARPRRAKPQPPPRPGGPPRPLRGRGGDRRPPSGAGCCRPCLAKEPSSKENATIWGTRFM